MLRGREDVVIEAIVCLIRVSGGDYKYNFNKLILKMIQP